MRSDPVTLASGTSVAADFKTKGVYLDQIYACSIQAVTSGTAALGTIKVEVSNDNVQPVSGTNSSQNVVNWVTHPTAGTIAVSGAGAGFIDVPQTGARWVRASFVAGTDSVGTTIITYNGKG